MINVCMYSLQELSPHVSRRSFSIKSQLYNLSGEVHALSRILKSHRIFGKNRVKNIHHLWAVCRTRKNNQLLTYLSLKLWHHLCFHHVKRVSCAKIDHGISNSNRPFRDIENSRVGILEWLPIRIPRCPILR